VRRRTPEYIVFFNATSGVRMAYRQIINFTAKIKIIICAEPSKLGHAHEQIHVHLISRLVGHLTLASPECALVLPGGASKY
jgi:hypothetical protein